MRVLRTLYSIHDTELKIVIPIDIKTIRSFNYANAPHIRNLIGLTDEKLVIKECGRILERIVPTIDLLGDFRQPIPSFN